MALDGLYCSSKVIIRTLLSLFRETKRILECSRLLLCTYVQYNNIEIHLNKYISTLLNLQEKI